MNQDPTQLPQDTNAQTLAATAELAAQPTPAESIGLTDGQFNVRKSIHDKENIDQGWTVDHVKTVVDSTTGQQRQEVMVTKLVVDAEGNPVVDEDGDQIERAKLYWVDDLLSWQKSEAEESAEVIEAEHALGHVGAPVVHAEVDVEMLPTEDTAETSKQQDQTLSAEFKQRASGDLNSLFMELNRFAAMPDAAVNNGISKLIDYGQRQHVDIRRTYDGATIGAIHDPRFANTYYTDNVRPSLQELFGADTAALRRIDDVITTHIQTMQTGPNQDVKIAQELKSRLVSSIIEQSRSIKNKISADNPQAVRQAELFLQGLALGLSDNATRGNAEQLVRKTLLKN